MGAPGEARDEVRVVAAQAHTSTVPCELAGAQPQGERDSSCPQEPPDERAHSASRAPSLKKCSSLPVTLHGGLAAVHELPGRVGPSELSRAGRPQRAGVKAAMRPRRRN